MKQELSMEDWSSIFRCIQLLKSYNMPVDESSVKAHWDDWCTAMWFDRVKKIPMPTTSSKEFSVAYGKNNTKLAEWQ